MAKTQIPEHLYWFYWTFCIICIMLDQNTICEDAHLLWCYAVL